MSATTFVVVFALLVAGISAQSSPSSPAFSAIPSSDLNLNKAGIAPSSYYSGQYSVTPTQQGLRYIGWHVEVGTNYTFTAAWTTGCAGDTGASDYATDCGLGLFKVLATEATGAAKFTELRWVHNYQFLFWNGLVQKPVSVDFGNEGTWGLSTLGDYLATLWFVSEGSGEVANNNVLLNMKCTLGEPVPASDISLDHDKFSFTPNGPACNYQEWVTLTSSSLWPAPPNPAMVSSGGYLPSASYTPGDQRCNLAVISGNDGQVWWGGYQPSYDSAVCAWMPIADAPAAGFVSVANGYDVIWTISAGATPVIKYHSLGTLGQLTEGDLSPYTTAVVLPSPPTHSAGSPGWVTVTNFPTTPFFVDAFNSTLVYIVDTNQHLWKLNAALSWTRVKIPVVSPGTGLIGTGPMASTTFAPNVAAVNVGPDAVYVEDNAAQQGGSVNNHFRFPY